MIEFFSDGPQYIISFDNYGKITISEENFEVSGNVSEVAVQFSKYLYSYMENDSHQHAESHMFFNEKHTIQLTFGSAFSSHVRVKFSLFKNKDFKINLKWSGKPNEQWVEFKNTVDRYFSLKTFL